jgi:hypothetical protein
MRGSEDYRWLLDFAWDSTLITSAVDLLRCMHLYGNALGVVTLIAKPLKFTSVVSVYEYI